MNKLSNFTHCCFFLVTIYSPVRAELLKNIINDADSSYTTQTQGVCSEFYETRRRLICLPENYTIIPKGTVQIAINAKANEQDFKLINKFINEKVNESDLQKLFGQSSFLHATGQSTISTIYRNTEFAFMPIYFTGGLKISNPVSPNLSMSALKGTQLRIGHYFIFRDWFGSDYGEIMFSPRIWVQQREFYNADFNIIELAGAPIKEHIEKAPQKNVDGSLALSVISKYDWWPSLHFKIAGLNEASRCDVCDQRFIDVEKQFLMRSQFVANVSKYHRYGASIFGINVPFFGPFDQLDGDKVATSYIYKLARLSSMVSFSPIMASFGFIFESDNFSIGIQYSDEKQANQFAIDRMKQTYVATSYHF